MPNPRLQALAHHHGTKLYHPRSDNSGYRGRNTYEHSPLKEIEERCISYNFYDSKDYTYEFFSTYLSFCFLESCFISYSFLLAEDLFGCSSKNKSVTGKRERVYFAPRPFRCVEILRVR